MTKNLLLCGISAALLMTGCETRSTLNNSPGVPSIYRDTASQGQVSGLGIESQDIESMSDKMVRDILASPQIVARKIAPRIIIDSSDFKNQSSERIDKDMITDSIYTDLLRSSYGRIVFLKRDYVAAVEQERDLKRIGRVTEGALGSTTGIHGADFKLIGRISAKDSIHPKTGIKERYTIIFFSLLDLETGAAIWANSYKYKKSTTEDIIYR